jgi:hypothetical protein
MSLNGEMEVAHLRPVLERYKHNWERLELISSASAGRGQNY